MISIDTHSKEDEIQATLIPLSPKNTPKQRVTKKRRERAKSKVMSLEDFKKQADRHVGRLGSPSLANIGETDEDIAEVNDMESVVHELFDLGEDEDLTLEVGDGSAMEDEIEMGADFPVSWLLPLFIYKHAVLGCINLVTNHRCSYYPRRHLNTKRGRMMI